jgi:hypothetical protein
MERKRIRTEETKPSSIRKRPRAGDERTQSLVRAINGHLSYLSQDKKRPRTDRRDSVRRDSEHAVDTVYAEYHDEEGHFRFIPGESVGDVVDINDPSRRRYKLLRFVPDLTVRLLQRTLLPS